MKSINVSSNLDVLLANAVTRKDAVEQSSIIIQPKESCLTVNERGLYIILSPTGAVSSAVEHRSYKPGATGSSPVPPTNTLNNLQ
jgi:hypothetical protein